MPGEPPPFTFEHEPADSLDRVALLDPAAVGRLLERLLSRFVLAAALERLLDRLEREGLTG